MFFLCFSFSLTNGTFRFLITFNCLARVLERLILTKFRLVVNVIAEQKLTYFLTRVPFSPNTYVTLNLDVRIEYFPHAVVSYIWHLAFKWERVLRPDDTAPQYADKVS